MLYITLLSECNSYLHLELYKICEHYNNMVTFNTIKQHLIFRSPNLQTGWSFVPDYVINEGREY